MLLGALLFILSLVRCVELFPLLGNVCRCAKISNGPIIVITVNLFLFYLFVIIVLIVKNNKNRKKIKFRITLRIADFFEGFFRVKYGG